MTRQVKQLAVACQGGCEIIDVLHYREGRCVVGDADSGGAHPAMILEYIPTARVRFGLLREL
jgi:hypothetical protein